MQLKINAERWNDPSLHNATGIYVRALTPDGKWADADICQLERDSIVMWTKSRDNGALNTLLVLMGYADQLVLD